MFHGKVLENIEVKKETKEPLDDDGLVDIETYEDELMIVDKPLMQENIEVKKETKEEPLDDNDLVNIETYEDDPMIIDKPLTQEIFDNNFVVVTHSSHERNVHKRKIEKNFSCDKYELFFNQKQDLEKHMKEIHQGKSGFKCEECDKIFS